MQEKIAIRKKAFVKRKNKYFEVSNNFFSPLDKLLSKKKKFSLCLVTTLQTMKLML